MLQHEKRWRIIFYKREKMPDGRVVDIEIERFENARGIYSGGVLQDSHGRLRFETEDRHEVLSGGVAFIAVETPSPVK